MSDLDKYRQLLLSSGIAAEIMSGATTLYTALRQRLDEATWNLVDAGRFYSSADILILPPDKDVVRKIVAALNLILRDENLSVATGASARRVLTVYSNYLRPPVDTATTPDLTSYDTVIVTFSGGKDSLASLLRTLELAKEQGRDLIADKAIELWHHDVDSPEEVEARGSFMDWPVTPAYVRAVADELGIPVYFSWKVGGFLREMLRKDSLTAPTKWEEPGGLIGQAGGERGKPSTRLRFPQVSADLSVRWCSAYLKIDVGSAAIRNQPRFLGKRTLVVSGERAEESPGRARYKQFEPDRAHLPGKRHVDHWRPVHQWKTTEVWEIIRRWGIVAHPAYRLGMGRVSCAFCIFGSPNQWATLKELLPEGFDRIAVLEKKFGSTIHRTLSVTERAEKGTAYPISDADVREGRRLVVKTTYNAPIRVSPKDWVLPAGAYAEAAGPT